MSAVCWTDRLSDKFKESYYSYCPIVESFCKSVLHKYADGDMYEAIIPAWHDDRKSILATSKGQTILHRILRKDFSSNERREAAHQAFDQILWIYSTVIARAEEEGVALKNRVFDDIFVCVLKSGRGQFEEFLNRARIVCLTMNTQQMEKCLETILNRSLVRECDDLFSGVSASSDETQKHFKRNLKSTWGQRLVTRIIKEDRRDFFKIFLKHINIKTYRIKEGEERKTLLYMLAERNRPLLIKHLYEAHPDRAFATIEISDRKDRTALYRATELNHFACVRMLILFGANYRHTVNGRTPLQVADPRFCRCYFRDTAGILRNAEHGKFDLDPRARNQLGEEEFMRRVRAGRALFEQENDDQGKKG